MIFYKVIIVCEFKDEHLLSFILKYPWLTSRVLIKNFNSTDISGEEKNQESLFAACYSIIGR